MRTFWTGLCAACLLAAVMTAQPAAQPPEGPPPGPPPGGPAAGPPPEPGPPPPGITPPGPAPQKRPGAAREARGREMLEQVMVARLSAELGLTDEQSVLMVRRFSQFKKETQQLQRERAEVMKELRQTALKGDADPAAVSPLLEKSLQLGEKIALQRQRLFHAMAEGMDPVQQGKLLVFLEEFEGQMRQVVKTAQERRTPGPPDRMGPPPGGQPGPPPGPGIPRPHKQGDRAPIGPPPAPPQE
ncbi:MAG TPA: hypothetical protein PKN23_12700 [Candidatus Hydrogenedentes bacterium]|nr:hypothetical protein [Candidatus Hydrogenedentota bacterium]